MIYLIIKKKQWNIKNYLHLFLYGETISLLFAQSLKASMSAWRWESSGLDRKGWQTFIITRSTYVGWMAWLAKMRAILVIACCCISEVSDNG